MFSWEPEQKYSLDVWSMKTKSEVTLMITLVIISKKNSALQLVDICTFKYLFIRWEWPALLSTALTGWVVSYLCCSSLVVFFIHLSTLSVVVFKISFVIQRTRVTKSQCFRGYNFKWKNISLRKRPTVSNDSVRKLTPS